jgi:hypothetical protein
MPQDHDPDWLCAKRRDSVHFTFPRPCRPRAALLFPIYFLFPVVLALGCGGSGPSESPEAAHIGKVGQLATEFKNANSGNNPKNIDELKSWAEKNGKADGTDFVSTRDHEPYVLDSQFMSRGGGTAAARTMASRGPLVIHEASGKNGKKFVVQGVVPQGSEMSEEGLKYLTRGPGDHKGK